MSFNKILKTKTAGYNPSFFEAEDFENAKSIILTPEPGTSTKERWAKETPFLIEQIGHFLKPDENSFILDYGCGIGRIAKGLIQNFNCNVVGVDISASMRKLALDYVNSEKFSIFSPQELDRKAEDGFTVDHVISIWVLQHCEKPVSDIFRIKSVLKKKGLFFVINNNTRALPTDTGWVNDDIDIKALLMRHFNSLHLSTLSDDATITYISENTFISVLQKI